MAGERTLSAADLVAGAATVITVAVPTALLGQCLDRRRLQPVTAPGRAWRLGIDHPHVMRGIEQRGENRRGKIRRSHENEVERGRHV